MEKFSFEKTVIDPKQRQEFLPPEISLTMRKIEELGTKETVKYFESQPNIEPDFLKTVKIVCENYAKIFGHREENKKKYHPYYPISNYSIIYQIVDKDSLKRNKIKKIEPSIFAACREICLDILEHQEEENDTKYGHGKKNIKFAKEFLAKIGEPGYSEFLPKTINKKKVMKNVNSIFSDFTLKFPKCGIQIVLNDRAKSEYADDNIYITIHWN